jgi:hypothetical protein
MHKINFNFKINWDPEKLTSSFPTNSRSEPIHVPPGQAHWYLFDKKDIKFAKNFYQNYKNECIEIADQLIQIQKMYSTEYANSNNYLISTFINSTISPHRINLISTVPGKDIKLHRDVTRTICINIGLKNSNKWETYISEDPKIENFNNSKKHAFTMQEGDAYILDIKNPHYAKCIEPTDISSTRYVCTYNVLEFGDPAGNRTPISD